MVFQQHTTLFDSNFGHQLASILTHVAFQLKVTCSKHREQGIFAI